MTINGRLVKLERMFPGDPPGSARPALEARIATAVALLEAVDEQEEAALLAAAGIDPHAWAEFKADVAKMEAWFKADVATKDAAALGK